MRVRLLTGALRKLSYLMRAELFNPFDQTVLLFAGAYKGRGLLTPKAYRSWWGFVGNMMIDKPERLADAIGALDGYNISVSGEGSLRELANGGLIASSYQRSNPLHGTWSTVLLSHLVQENTGQELRWTQSHGKWPQSIAHVQSAIMTNGILVGVPKAKGQGGNDALNAMREGSIVGLYPEGYDSPTLREARPESGKLIHGAAELNRPVIVVAAYAEGRDLIAHCEVKQPQDVLKYPRSKVADWTMREIAKLMPEEYRGFYQSNRS